MESHDETLQRLEREKADQNIEKQRLQIATAIEEAAKMTFRRLNQLILRGYRPEFGERNFSDAIFLRHPSGKAQFPTLILYPVGFVVGPPKGPGEQELRLPLDDALAFDGFLRTVPAPTWWERTRDARGIMIAWTAVQLPFYLLVAWGFLEMISK